MQTENEIIASTFYKTNKKLGELNLSVENLAKDIINSKFSNNEIHDRCLSLFSRIENMELEYNGNIRRLLTT